MEDLAVAWIRGADGAGLPVDYALYRRRTRGDTGNGRLLAKRRMNVFLRGFWDDLKELLVFDRYLALAVAKGIGILAFIGIFLTGLFVIGREFVTYQQVQMVLVVLCFIVYLSVPFLDAAELRRKAWYRQADEDKK
jgi:hypothetical protein